MLTGTISGEVDPKDPKNAIVQDLALAPVNARRHGRVFGRLLSSLKPKDMSKASGVLRYDAPNRGNIRDHRSTPPRARAMRSTRSAATRAAVLGWQGDVPKSSPARLTVTVPVAKNADGTSITGTYRTELVPGAAAPAMTLPGGVFNGTMIPYAPASLDNTQPGYSLTRRASMRPMRAWRFRQRLEIRHLRMPAPTRSPARLTRAASACAAASIRSISMNSCTWRRTRR